MEQYKPGYLGKVIPADDPSKLTDFLTNKYDPFNKIYDACKGQSAQIADVKPVDTGSSDSSSLSVKVSADKETIEKIKEAAAGDNTVTVNNDVVTAKGTEPDKK